MLQYYYYEYMLYILYSILFTYLLTNQSDFLNQIEMSKIRLLYFNAIDLILLIPETIKVGKESCGGCLGRRFSFLSFLVGERTKI